MLCGRPQTNLADNELCGLAASGQGTYTTEGIKAIAYALRDNASLTECSLRNNRLGAEGWTIIFDALRNSSSSRITTWDLSHEHVGPEIVRPLANYISESRSLTTINLSNNSLVWRFDGWSCDVKGLGCLKGGPRRWSCLRGCNWDACDVCHLSGHWHRHELELIDAFAGVKHLVDALRVNHGALTSVSLLGNKFDDDTAALLLKLKGEKPTLITLCGLKPDQTEASFLHTGLGPADAKLLAPEIAVHTALRSLDLSGNKLGPEGAKALAPGLVSCSLHWVNVRLNLLSVAAKEQLRASAPDREGFELLL